MKFEEKNGKSILKDFNPEEALRIATYVEEGGSDTSEIRRHN